MFKNVLLASTLALSSVANANLIVDFDLDYQWGEVDPTGVVLNTPLWDHEDAIEDIMNAVLPQSLYVQLDLVGDSHGWRKPSVGITGDSLTAYYHVAGEQCLQDSAILIREYDRSDDSYMELGSGCYRTLDSYRIDLNGLYSLVDGSMIDFGSISNIGGWTEYGLANAQVSIEREYYPKGTYIPGELDDLIGDLGGVLKVNHQVLSSQLKVVYASEPATLGVFTLGILGLLSMRRNKKQL